MAEKTKTLILNAAESLFAEHGFGDTSLRNITGEAKVNLASVNYHFGSKKYLIQSVLERYLTVLMPEIDKQLTAFIESDEIPHTAAVIGALKEPLLSLNNVRPNGASLFVQLLGRGYTESQGHLRKFITERYGETLHNFVEQIHRAMPGLAPVEIFWRLHFAIGTFVFTMASSQALTDIAVADYDQQPEIADVINRLVDFVAAGLSGEPV